MNTRMPCILNSTPTRVMNSKLACHTLLVTLFIQVQILLGKQFSGLSLYQRHIKTVMDKETKLNLKNICNVLAVVKDKWEEIGTQLGIPKSTLRGFEKKTDSLSEVIDYCMMGNLGAPISWNSIAKALASEHVGEQGLANKIIRDYGEKIIYCPEHDRKVELYCETCKKFICFPCIKKGEAHHDHDYKQVTNKVTNEEIEETLKDAEKHQADIEQELKKWDGLQVEISKQKKDAESEINEAFRQLELRMKNKKMQEKLDGTKNDLIIELGKIVQDKLEHLEAQKKEILDIQSELGDHYKSLKEQSESLLKKSYRVIRMKSMFPKINLIPTEKADLIIVDESSELSDEKPCPSKCYVKGQTVLTARAKEQSTALIQLVDSKSRPCKASATTVTWKCASEINNQNKHEGTEELEKVSQYEIRYKPKIKGRHKLKIKVDGQHIKGSPLPVMVTSDLGPAIKVINQDVKLPKEIAVTRTGMIFVASEDEGYLAWFSSDQKNPIGTRLKFNPSGIAVDKDEKFLLVVVRVHRTILKFAIEEDTSLKEVKRYNSQFSSPLGIAINPSNNMVYIIDTWDGPKIIIMDLDFNLHKTFGTEGCGEGQFIEPQAIACDCTGNVYVANGENYGIQVFTAEGQFLRMFGNTGEQGRNWYQPYGMAVDSQKLVYVSDEQNNRVCVFTDEGKFKYSFGSHGAGQAQFYCPRGLAVDQSGVLYVCDCGNNRILLI